MERYYKYLVCVALCAIIFFSNNVYAEDFVITQITNDNYNNYSPQINDYGQITWWGMNKTTTGNIFLYSNNSIYKVTDNTLGNGYPWINNRGDIVWQGNGDGNSSEIYLSTKNNPDPLRITNNSWGDYRPKINDKGDMLWYGWQGVPYNNKLYFRSNENIVPITNGDYPVSNYYLNNNQQIVWSGSNAGSGFYIWDNGNTIKLSNSGGQSSIGSQINDNGQVVFTKYESGLYQIYHYNSITKETIKISQNDLINNWKPQINKEGQILWEGWNGSSKDLYLYDKGIIKQITTDGQVKSNYLLNNLGQVVWLASDGNDSEIYLWRNGNIKQITNNNTNESGVTISNTGQLAWQSKVGDNYQIFKADPKPYESKLYGLFIGIKDGENLRGDFDASNFYDALIRKKIIDPRNATVMLKDGNETTGDKSIKWNDIDSAIKNINDKMKDGDRLLLYFSSHGNHFEDGTETTKNKGDEYIFLNEANALTDTNLYLMLRDNITKDVSKMCIMDVCQSGGFWGNFNEANPDLEQLSNIALLAGAPEGKDCYSDVGLLWGTGLGLFTNVLIDGINEGITDWDALAEYAKDHKPFKNPQPVYEKEKGDIITFIPDMWEPVSFKTADFTGNLEPVPLPSAILLLGAGIIRMVIYRQKLKNNN